MDELFDSLKKQTAAPSAAEENGTGAEGDLSDEPEQQRKGKRRGEVEDLFAKLKRHRTAKADKQVSTTQWCHYAHACFLQAECLRGVCRQQCISPSKHLALPENAQLLHLD